MTIITITMTITPGDLHYRTSFRIGQTIEIFCGRSHILHTFNLPIGKKIALQELFVSSADYVAITMKQSKILEILP